MTSRRRTLAGAVVALTLAAGLVLAGSLTAQADGGLEITTTTTPATGGGVITGTPSVALPAGPVDVLYGAPGTPLGGMSALGPATIAGATWTFNSLLPPGIYQVGVESGANTDSELVEVTLPTPTVTGPDSAPEGGTFTFEGTGGYVGATITVSIPGAETETGDTLTCSTGVLASSGNWTCSPIAFDAELIPGPTYTFDVTQTRPTVAPGDAPTATTNTWDVTIQDLPDVLEVTSPADGADITWAPTITISGTAPGTMPDVSLEIDGVPSTECANLAVSAMRTWSCDTTALTVDSHTVMASQGGTDSAVVAFDVVYPAPDVTSTDPHVGFAGQTIFVTGTTTYPGVTIEITTSTDVGSCSLATPMPIDTDWSCPLAIDTGVSGAFDLYVEQELAGSPVGPFWLGELQVLESPVISSPVADTDVDWTGTATTISGIADPAGGTIDLARTTGGSPDPIPGCQNVTVPAGGAWSCDAVFAPGVWDIYASQGSVTVSVLDWSVYVPAPAPDDAPLVVPNTEQFVVFTGTNLFEDPDYTVVVSMRGTGFICGDDDPAPNVYSCDIEAWGEFVDGYYTVDVYQQGLTPGVPYRTRTFDLTYGSPAAPTLTIDGPANNTDVTYDSDPNFLVVDGSTAEVGAVTVYLDGATTAFCTAVPAAGAWSCPGTSLPPGAHTVLARQDGQPSAQANFDVALPEPGVNGLPLFFDQDQDLVFGGQQMYPGAWTRVEVYEEAEGSPFGSPVIEEDCAPASGNWSCTIPQNLSGGQYLVSFTHFLPGDPSIPGDRAGYYTLTIDAGPIGGAANLRCTFSPGGGVRVSSPLSMDNLDLNAVYDEVGSSSGDAFGLQGYCNGGTGSDFPTGDDLYFDLIQNCTTTCSQSSLDPGTYEVYYTVADSADNEGFSFEPHSYLFTVPTEPVISTVASTTNSVVLSGSAQPGATVRIVRSSGAALCTTTANGSGAWGCQFVKSTATTARAIAIDPSGAMSTYTAERTIPEFVAPPAVPTEEPELVTWFLEFGGDLMDLHPGDSFTLNVSGMPEGTAIEVWMHSTPALIGTATGTGLPMELTLTVPQDVENGAHEIEMIGVTPLGTHYFFTSDAWVSGGTDPLPPLKDASPLDDKTGIGPYDRTDPASPSALSDGLAPVSAIAANPASIAIAGGLALALLFLVALPTELLNSSLSSNTSRLGRAYGTVDGALTKAQDWFIKVTRSRAIAAAILTTIVAIIYGFVDPGFGFDIVSLRLVLSLAIAFFLLSFVASWISGIIIRRAWGAMGVIAMQPTIILFAIVGVIVARVLDFSPGFLVGIAIGLELLQASRTVSARAVFVQIAVVTGLALAAWGVYSVFTPGDDFVGMLVEDTMVAVTAEGLTGALIALFPLRFLDGHDLWAVSKRLWVLAFLIVATSFALLVLPTAVQGTDVADYGVWLLVFAVFGLGSLAVWLIFVRADKKAAEAEKETVDA